MEANTEKIYSEYMPPFLRGRSMLVAVALVIAAGIGIRIANLSDIRIRSPYERDCAKEAQIVLNQGITDGIRKLATPYNPEFGMPPSRAGYIWLVANTMEITGVSDIRAVSYVSTLASIGSLLILAIIAWTFFSPRIALLALCFYAVSTAELEFARRAWQDSPAEFLALILLYIVCRITKGERSTVWYALFGLVAAVSVTVKENAAVAAVLCMVWGVWMLLRAGSRKDAVKFGGYAIAGIAAASIWLAYLVGGLHNLIDISTTSVKFFNDNKWSIEQESGSPLTLLQMLWTVSPVIFIGAVFGLAIVFRDEWKNRRSPGEKNIALLISIFFLAFIAQILISPHHLNLRYISVSCGPSCLIGAMGLSYLIHSAKSLLKLPGRYTYPAIAAIVIAIGVRIDYGTFQTFAGSNACDMTAQMVLDPLGWFSRSEIVQTDLKNQDSPPDFSAAEEDAIIHPTADNFLALSNTYYNAKRFSDCIDAARKALALKPDYAEAYNNLGVAYNSMSRWDSAIPALAYALKIKPDYQLARNNLNWAETEKNRTDSTFIALEETAAAKPSPDILVSLSLEYYNRRRYQDCISAAQKAIEMKPDFPSAYNNIAAAYMELSQWQNAIDAARKALLLAPDFELAKNNLNYSIAQQKLEQR